MYKRYDYRCLKPLKNISSEKWPYYEMHGFRNAKTKKDLEQVKEIKYDKYFFNFEDPEVFKEMTSRKKGRRLWKRTYGFDFVSINKYPKQPVAATECHRYCFKAEHAKFARICRSNGGFFKCCQMR